MSDFRDARAALSHFTPERPMFVPPTMYAQMRLIPELSDMMDRVRVTPKIPMRRAH